MHVTREKTHIPRAPLAFGLGMLGVVVTWVLAESRDAEETLHAYCKVQAAWCFICQFLLSIGNVRAHRNDWPIMLALNAITLLIVMGSLVAGGIHALSRLSLNLNWSDVREYALLLMAPASGTYAGAVLASVLTRLTSQQR